MLLFHVQTLGAERLHLAGLARAPFGDGWSGVDLFFVLSGFILMRTHGAEFERPGAGTLKRFAIARFFRVYPLNLVVLLLIAALVAADRNFAHWYAADGYHNLRPPAFVRTALLATRWFLPGDGEWNQPVWSLSVEVLGYLAFPVIAWGLMRLKSTPALALVALASLAALLAVQVFRNVALTNDIGQVGAFTRMIFCFFAGAAASRAAALAPGFRGAPAAEIVAVVGLVASCFSPFGLPLRPLLFTVLIFALSYRQGPVDRALSTRAAVFLGRISFPLYLVHVMLLLAVCHDFAGAAVGVRIAALVGGALAAFALATALHYLLERPTHQLGRRIAGRVG